MAGKGRLNGDLSRFNITDFTHQDAVRVLPQNCPQSGGKCDTKISVNRHLHDALNVILDRVFGGDDLVVGFVEFGQGRVEGGGFP